MEELARRDLKMNFLQIYTRLCRYAGRSEKIRGIQSPSEKLEENLEFLNLEVEGKDVISLATLGVMLGSGVVFIVMLLTWKFNLTILLPISSMPLPVLIYLSIGKYPEWKANNKRTKLLGGAPLLISYIAIALKINSNLERSVKFSAEHVNNPLGKDLRDELWKGLIRANREVKEVLSEFGKKWKNQGKELKQSIDLIKSSISEKNEDNRKEILDQALETSFLGINSRMESFAASLQLPTVVIYGIGVLLPLVLLAVLPVLSSTGINVTGTELFLVYCFFLPLIVYLTQKQTLAKRPAAFPAPDIPSEDNRGKAISISIIVAIVPLIFTAFFKIPNQIVVLIFLWSLSSGIAIFCYLSSAKTYRIREMNRSLEGEFCDSLTQLGNQLKSNIPAEKAFRRTAKTTKWSEISKILEKTSANIEIGGMNVQTALFDPEVGSLKDVHSPPIRNTFRMLKDLLNQSTHAAGEAITYSASHLKRLKKLETRIRRNLNEIVSSMKSVAVFFAPLITSVTIQLQQMLSRKTSGMPLFGSGVQISPSIFLGTLGFYVIILTMLLSSYAVEIEWGKDRLIKRMSIARALPTAMIVFTLGLFLGNQMLKFLVG